MFFAFFPSFSSPNFSFIIFLKSWGVHTTLCKILDTLDEKPQRNGLSKLGTLKCECPQLLYSAMMIHHHYPIDDDAGDDDDHHDDHDDDDYDVKKS